MTPRIGGTLACVILLSGCANSAKNIPAQYVSTLQYQNYTCQQIEGEMMVVSRHVAELAGQCDKKADNDSVKMGVGLVLFWPTLFFLDGNGTQAVEYGRLKGEFDALEKTSVMKNCNIPIEKIKPPEPTPEPPKAKSTDRKKITDL